MRSVGVPLPGPITKLTGIRDEELRRAPGIDSSIRRFLAFAGDATLVAHNARFDAAFLDRQLERLTGRRLGVPALDTAALARRLLDGRVRRVSLASLSYFYGTSATDAVPSRPRRRPGHGGGADPPDSARRRSGARARSPTCMASRRRAPDASMADARPRTAHPPGPASTASRTATGSCSTSGAHVTSAHGCVRSPVCTAAATLGRGRARRRGADRVAGARQ